ncbi:hypothetical protein QOM21_08760 [Streptomyces sp. Pv4-95]|uniref:hypothetical protein n=1 Tax=Streptomyces sp. Pv4-95 TaxID=3049543 RepID=UPI0038925645
MNSPLSGRAGPDHDRAVVIDHLALGRWPPSRPAGVRTLGPTWSLSLEVMFYLVLVLDALGPVAVRACRPLR